MFESSLYIVRCLPKHRVSSQQNRKGIFLMVLSSSSLVPRCKRQKLGGSPGNEANPTRGH